MQHQQRAREHYDYLVLGAGPAGLQLGYFLEKHGHNYQILERAPEAASFFAKFPRRRSLISFNKRNSLYDDPEIKLRWDWNSLLTDDYSHLFTDYSKKLYPHADDMVTYLRDYAERHVSKFASIPKLNISQKAKMACFTLKLRMVNFLPLKRSSLPRVFPSLTFPRYRVSIV